MAGDFNNDWFDDYLKNLEAKNQKVNNMKFLRKLLKIILPIMLIAGTIGVGNLIVHSTRKPKKKPPQRMAYAVEVMTVKTGEQTIKLRAIGTVIPALQIVLRSRVVGEVVYVAPELIAGGSFQQDDLVLTIDPVDYQLALEQKIAALAEAEYQLKLEVGRSDIAKREWDILEFDSESNKVNRELALRLPHMKYRVAKLKAAKAELKQATLNLERTEIRAPFNAVVMERNVNLGTQVTGQDPLAQLAGSDEFYVRASLPVARLSWIRCTPENGSRVFLTQNTGATRVGYVIRLESALEKVGRTARVLIQVKNPLQGTFPLLLNEYVHIKIEGSPIKNAVSIPRSALHNDRFVWLATKENTLEIREVNVRWRDATEAIIGGLTDGNRLILTGLAIPINGMKLRISNK